MTHCRHGHEMTPENTYRRPDGTLECRLCIKGRENLRSADPTGMQFFENLAALASRSGQPAE